MKSKQLLLAAVLLVLLAAAWIAALGAASDREAIEEQNRLWADAGKYAEKELWVRAIPKYEEALTYKTDRSGEIETQLLAAYEAYGDLDAYFALAQQRMTAGTAAEAEYIRSAELYLEVGEIEEAIAVAKKGMAVFGSERCEALYEDNRYRYDIRFTKFEEILPTQDNSYMPARDANGWTFVNAKGRAVYGTVRWSDVTAFNASGYAVVRAEDAYIVITKSGDRFAVDDTVGLDDVHGLTATSVIGEKDGVWGLYNADFVPRTEGIAYEAITQVSENRYAAKKDGAWGILDASGATVSGFQFEDAAQNSWGAVYCGNTAMVCYGGAWYMLDETGAKRTDTTFADAKAPESTDGWIAVANEDGLWGFADRSGTLVIDYQYEDAKSFSDNLAAVKTGGEWVYISTANTVVIDNVFYEAQPFRGGVAQAVTPQGAAVLVLEFPGI